MILEEDEEQATKSTESGGGSQTGETQSPQSGGKEAGTRIGPRVDVRGADVQEGGSESENIDKMRDGT